MTDRGGERETEEGRSPGPVLFWLTPSDRIEWTSEGEVLFPGETLARHLFRSLRAQVGDRFLFVDPDQPGRGRWARVESVTPPRLTLSEISQETPVRRRAFDLAVALLKGEGWEDLVEPAAILGVRRLVPLLADRSQLRWSSAVLEKKRERLMAKVREASQLAGRADRMEIADPVTLPTLLARMPVQEALLFCDTVSPTVGVREALDRLGTSPSVAAIGPEGGWSERERALVEEFGQKGGALHRVSLGPLVLPGRLAPVVVASLLSQEGEGGERGEGS